MADAVVAELALAAFEVGASETGAYLTMYAAEAAVALQVATTVASIAYTQQQARHAAQAARDQNNASLKDRYTMVRSALEPRTLVLGRQRVSGPVVYVGSYGPKREHLVYCVPIAGHEIDAVEAIYFGDEEVTLDVNGNVTGVNRRDTFSITTATGTFQLSSTPKAGSVTAKVSYGATSTPLTVTGTSVSGTVTSASVSGATAGQTGTLTISYQPDPSPFAGTTKTVSSTTVSLTGGAGTITLGTAPFNPYISEGGIVATCTVAGNVITITGATDVNGSLVTGTFGITYERSVSPTLCNVKAYLGASGQAADGDMIAALPGVWTSAHKATGIPYLRVLCTYENSAFPGGMPVVSARIRGAKVLDPRTGVTAWSENPSLLARHAALHPYCGNLASGMVPSASVITAANVCDTAAAYVVQGQTYNRKLYTAGLVVRSGTRGADALDALCQAMAGDWAWVDGELRLWAGAYVTPTLTITDAWLSTAGSIKVQPAAHRGELVNTVTGTFADEWNDYKELPHPKVAASAYVTSDGRALPTNRPLQAVTFIGQAQQCQAAWIRENRQGQTFTLTLNERANQLEWRDPVMLTLERYGQSAKPYIVRSITPSLSDGHVVTLGEIDPSIWALGTTFAANDPAPNTALRSPYDIPLPPTLTLASGTSALLKLADGTIVPRIAATWTPVTDVYVTDPGGGMEIAWGPAEQLVPTWSIIKVDATSGAAYLPDVKEGAVYGVRSRLFGNAAPGPWGGVKVLRVVGKTAAPSNVAGLAAAVQGGQARITWTPCPDIDYFETEVRIGSTWAGGTTLFRGNAQSAPWAPYPAEGSYTIWATNYDSTGNASTPQSIAVAVSSVGSIFVGGNVLPNADFTGYTGTSALPDGWIPYAVGTLSGQSWARVATGSVDNGAWVYIHADSLGGTSSDRIGMAANGNQSLPLPNGGPVVISGHVIHSSTSDCFFYGEYKNSSGALITSFYKQLPAGSNTWKRYEFFDTAPAGTYSIFFYVWCQGNGSAAALNTGFDKLSVSPGDSSLPFAPKAGEVYPGQVGTVELANNAATDIYSDYYDFAGASGPSGPGGQPMVPIRGISFTVPVNCKVDFSAKVELSGGPAVNPSNNQADWVLTSSLGAFVVLGRAFASDPTPREYNATNVYDATAGEVITISFRMIKNTSGAAAQIWQSYIVAPLRKR
jgi:Putative phage tail protein